MRQVAQETARGQRSQPYMQRRPLGDPASRSQGPRPTGPRGPRFGQGAPAMRPGPHPGPMGPRPDRLRRDGPPHGARKPYRTGVQSAGDGPPRPSPVMEEPALARIRALLSGYQPTAAMLAAYSLGIFTELHRQAQTRDDLLRAIGIDARGLDALLDALISVGVVHRHGPTLVLPREYAPYLVPGSDGDATGMIEMAPDLVEAWAHLASGMKEGTPRHRLSSEALIAGDPERVRRYIRGVHTTSREAARRLVELAPLLPGSSLLDVGGGSGIFAAEYARRTPDLKAFVFDLPPTLEAARSILRTEGLEEAVEYTPGDYRLDPFPGPVDTILVSNVFQTESEENALLILRKAYEALRPGGTLLVHGGMAETSGTPSAPIAHFALLMYVLFDQGRAWSAEKISEWLAQERFGVRVIRPLGSPFYTKLIVASRLE